VVFFTIERGVIDLLGFKMMGGRTKKKRACPKKKKYGGQETKEKRVVL